MKRNKIKKKYLDLIRPSNNMLSNKINKGLITLMWICLLLTWGYIPYIFTSIIGIDYNILSTTTKTIFMFINDLLFLFIIVGVYYKDLKKDFKGYFNKNFKDNLKLSLKYWLSGLLIMFISNLLISFVIGEITNNEETVRSLINSIPVYMAFDLAIYAPLTEELIFRKSIRDIFNNQYIYAIVSGIIFGGLHILSSITGLVSLLYLIPYCSLGIAFGLLYYKTNNIFSTIVIHSIHNSMALILYLVVL